METRSLVFIFIGRTFRFAKKTHNIMNTYHERMIIKMSKFTNWTNKPITWGGYIKFGLISTVISILIGLLTIYAPIMTRKVKESKNKIED